MKRYRFLWQGPSTLALILFVSACGDVATGPIGPVAPTVVAGGGYNASTASFGSTVEVVESSISETWVGSREILAFSDTDGNDYRLEGTWGSAGELIQLQVWFNNALVGTDDFVWNGLQLLSRTHQGPQGQWVTTNSANEVTGWYQNGGGIDCPDSPGGGNNDPPIEQPGVPGCDDDPETMVRSDLFFSMSSFGGSCWTEWGRYMGASLEVALDAAIGLGSLGLAIIAPEPAVKGLAGMVAFGSLGKIGFSAKKLWERTNEYMECVTEQ